MFNGKNGAFASWVFKPKNFTLLLSENFAANSSVDANYFHL